MKNRLVIIGAGGHGKVAADIANRMGKWQSIVFLDDQLKARTQLGLEVAGATTDAPHYVDEYDMIIAIGNNVMRQTLQTELESKGATFPILIHPSAVVGVEVTLEAGTVVMPGAVINCSSAIGKGCIINTGATVGHDNIIRNYVHVSSGCHLAGTVTVAETTWLGIGSVVSNNISIDEPCTIGAGAVVPKSITETGVYIGVPARKAD